MLTHQMLVIVAAIVKERIATSAHEQSITVEKRWHAQV